MKTAKINLSYDAAGMGTIKIDNKMAPLEIGVSQDDKIHVDAKLKIHSYIPGIDITEFFFVDRNEDEMEIILEKIPELAEAFWGSGDSRVKIFVPTGIKVCAKSENESFAAQELESELKMSTENGSIQVKDCSGQISLKSENGAIRIQKCDAELRVITENGNVSAEKVSGASFEAGSENGAIRVRQAAFERAFIQSENGRIIYEALPVEDATLTMVSENGPVQLALPENYNFQLEAISETGTLRNETEAELSEQDNLKIVRRGEGGAQISIKTENGDISLTSDDGAELNFIRLKIKELKQTMSKAVSEEDLEKVQKAWGTVSAAVEKALAGIREEGVKEKLNAAMDNMKKTVEEFDFKSAGGKVVKTVDQIGDEIGDILKSVFRKVREPRGEKTHWEEDKTEISSFEKLGDFISKTVDNAINKAFQGSGLDSNEKKAVDERSRAKILQMLENGKITAEEAEKLLKAIGVE